MNTELVRRNQPGSSSGIESLNRLEQLKKFTAIVGDTGELDLLRKYRPQDATTNPSLILAAVQKEQYWYHVEEVLHNQRFAAAGAYRMDDIIEHLLVQFGCAILEIIPGRVSTQIDVNVSYDARQSVEKARRLIKLYEARGVDRERVLIKLAATWEGIKAAELLEKEGIRCNMTLLFSLMQAARCAEAGVQLISPFVGRVSDWFKNATGRDYQGAEDPGVLLVKDIYSYFKQFGFKTEVMGASFRNVSQILELAGCDLLTISPALMEELSQTHQPVARKLDPAHPVKIHDKRLATDEKTFRYTLAWDPMASDRTPDGIRRFSADILKLEELIALHLESRSTSGASETSRCS